MAVAAEKDLTVDDSFMALLEGEMSSLQSSLRALHDALGQPHNTIAMQRQLGVGNTICWQIWRILQSDTPMREAMHAPSPQAIHYLLEAAGRVGVPVTTLSAVSEAAKNFQAFVREHANDRASFETLVAGVSGDQNEEQIKLHHRRAAYRAESHIWGIQRDLSGVLAFVRRSESGNSFDVAIMVIQLGYRRLRAGAAATMFAFSDRLGGDTDIVPLDKEGFQQAGGPVVRRFCSTPMPRLTAKASAGSATVYSLADTALGRCGSKDLTTGYLVRGDPLVMQDGHPYFSYDHSFFCPTARSVMEIALDRESFAAIPSAVVRSRRAEVAGGESEILPLNERVLPLGNTADAPGCKDLPQHREMLEFMAETAGWNVADFNSFRMTLDYPILSSRIDLLVPTR